MSLRRQVLFALIIVAVILFAAWEPAFAQCAMCKESIKASADAEAISRKLNLAVLVLLIPPVAIFAGIFGLFYRYRNVQGQEEIDK